MPKNKSLPVGPACFCRKIDAKKIQYLNYY